MGLPADRRQAHFAWWEKSDFRERVAARGLANLNLTRVISSP